jgi:hypothetical protein
MLMKRLNKSFVIFALGIFIISVFSVGSVSAGLFGKAKITAQVTLDSEGWTPWLNRDGPSGNGDYETLTDYVNLGQSCSSPSKVEYRPVNREKVFQNVHYGNTIGFYCLNSENPSGCLDYEVRFYCGEEDEEKSVCGNGVVDYSVEFKEECDGSNLGGATCASILGPGYSGSLGCSNSCEFDTSGCSLSVGSSTCTDSDGGLNWGVKGSVTYEKGKVTDTCTVDGTGVLEAYCKDFPDLGSSLGAAIHNCENGCVDGACAGNVASGPVVFLDDYGIYVDEDRFSQSSGEIYRAGFLNLKWTEVPDAKCYNIYRVDLDGVYFKTYSQCWNNEIKTSHYASGNCLPGENCGLAVWEYKVTATLSDGSETGFSNVVTVNFSDLDSCEERSVCVNEDRIGKLNSNCELKESTIEYCSSGFNCVDGACIEKNNKNLIAEGFNVKRSGDKEYNLVLSYSEANLAKEDNYWTAFYFKFEGYEGFDLVSYTSRSALELNGPGLDLEELELNDVKKVILRANMDYLDPVMIERNPTIAGDFVIESNEMDNCIEQAFEISEGILVKAGSVKSCDFIQDNEPLECFVNSDCDSGEECISGICVQERECFVDRDCPENYECSSGMCVEIPEGKCSSNECSLNGECYPLGYRKSGDYCSETGEFIKQVGDDVQCDNNFECGTNLCIDGQCISQGFLKKIFEWFGRLFG